MALALYCHYSAICHYTTFPKLSRNLKIICQKTTTVGARCRASVCTYGNVVEPGNLEPKKIAKLQGKLKLKKKLKIRAKIELKKEKKVAQGRLELKKVKTVKQGKLELKNDLRKVEPKKKVEIVEQVKLDPKLQCNSYRMKQNRSWSGGCSLGIDLGLARTGVAVSNGYAPRPLLVLEMRGEPLERRLMELAENEEVDELIVGIPKSFDGTENVQSNKVRSIAGRLAVRAAERGWRVYLQNEYGTSEDALDFMIHMGKNKRARHEKLDAYAAV
ncbi:hypothetical protein KI387_003829, partial [Taxus chinensis]